MKSTLPEEMPVKETPADASWPQTMRIWRRFGLALLVLALVLAKPLVKLVQVAYESEVFSYILLVPFVSVYLAFLRSKATPAIQPGPGSMRWATIPFGLGFCALVGSWLAADDVGLTLAVLAFVFFSVAAGLLTLGLERMRHFAFPFAFLIFLVPLPASFVSGIETFFQHTSADAASILINLSGLPVIRDGLFFRLPGLLIEVAQECSGIRSSLVLLITSVLAGHLFLRSPWRRAALALFVIPLAILRNGFRIFSLAYLTVEVDPKIIDSAIHHRGGPIFFALSLIPFFLFLVLLRKTERSSITK